MTPNDLKILKQASKIIQKMADWPKGVCGTYHPFCISCHWNVCIGILNEIIDTYEDKKEVTEAEHIKK